MDNLLTLQTAFQAHLLDTNEHHIYQSIISTTKMPAQKRMTIYSHAYSARLIEALAESYPMLFLYLGSDLFNQLALEYVKAYPSYYRSIRWFGDKFNAFLKNHPQYQQYLYLSELATLEWTMGTVFDAPTATVLTLPELAQMPPEAWSEMQLQAHPTVRRVDLSWNTIQIWQALSQDKQPDEPVQHDFPIPWILWRKEFINQFCSLSTANAWAIDAVLQGSNFGEICMGLTQWQAEENVATTAASLLKGWVIADLISAVKIKSYH